MNYHQLFSPFHGQTINIALIGAGQFGETFTRQCRRLSGIEINIVCDLDSDRDRTALLAAGYGEAGSVITTDMVVPPQGSTLWQLRNRMEADLSAAS